jgi:hypothetical protein
MTALSIQSPFPIITDIDGQPLEDGYIWIGVANLPPIGNPIAVYWDAALTQPAAQPIRTRGGYPVNSGTPARLYVGSDYSIQVQNKNGSVLYSAPDGASDRFSAAQISFLQAGSGAVVRTAQSKMRDVVSVKDFGAVGDGVADDTAAIQLAVAEVNANGGTLRFPPGDYRVSFPLGIASYTSLFAMRSNTAVIFDTGARMTASAVTGTLTFCAVFGADRNALPVTNIQFLNLNMTSLSAGVGQELASGINLATAPDAPADSITDVVIDGCSFFDFASAIYAVQRTSAGGLTRQVNGLRVSNNYGLGNLSFITADGANTTIQNNVIIGNPITPLGTYDGVSLHSTLDCVVDGNTISYYGENGVNIRNSPENFSGSARITVSNNTIHASRLKGIHINLQPGETVYGVTDIAVTGNTITHDAGANLSTGIACVIGTAGVGTPFKRIAITGNAISDHNAGIFISALAALPAENWVVTGNTIKTRVVDTSAAFFMQGMLLSTVTGNNVSIGYSAVAYNAVDLIDFYNSTFTGNNIYMDDTHADGVRFIGLIQSTISGNTIYGKCLFQTLNDNTLISGNYIKSQSNLEGRTVVGQFNYISGHIRLAQIFPYIPAGTWRKGDRIINDSPSEGDAGEYVCVVAGSPGTWVYCNQMGFLSGNGAPVTAGYFGQEYYDLVNNQWYKYGLAAWYALN